MWTGLHSRAAKIPEHNSNNLNQDSMLLLKKVER